MTLPNVSDKPPQLAKKKPAPKEPASPIIVFGLPLLLAGGFYYYCARINPSGVAAAIEQVLGMERANLLRGHLLQARAQVAARMPGAAPPAPEDEEKPLTRGQMTIKLAREARERAAQEARLRVAAPVADPAPEHQVTLHLTNGDWVTGELVRETPQEIVLRWDYGEAVFRRNEVAKVARHEGARAPAAPQVEVNTTAPLPPVADSAPEVTLHLKNGGLVTGRLSQDTPAGMLLRIDGGDVEFTHAEIERIERAQPDKEAP